MFLSLNQRQNVVSWPLGHKFGREQSRLSGVQELLARFWQRNQRVLQRQKKVRRHYDSILIDLAVSFLGSRTKRKGFGEKKQPFSYNVQNFYNNKKDKSMKKQRGCGSSHKKYTKISTKRRQNLVEKVVKGGLPVAKTAKALRINISTAKLILKKYKETGGFFHKKMSKSKPKVLRPTKKAVLKEELPPISVETEKLEEIAQPMIDSSEGTEIAYLYSYCYPLHFVPFPQMFQIPF